MDHRACAHAVIILKSKDGKAWWACRDCETPFAPVTTAQAEVAATNGSAETEYVSIRELTARIPYDEGSIRNMMSQGIFRRGVHYEKPRGKVVFRWSAIRAWLASRSLKAS